MFYRTNCCGHTDPIKLSKEDDYLSGLTESYIRQLFDDRKVSEANQKKLWEHYYNTFSKGIDLGYNPKPEMYNPALSHSLKYDIAKFSAFKATSFKNQLESNLTKDGKISPWSEFKKKADELNIQYNRNWLKTEYDHTVASANMAQQWQDFIADADLYPNLKFVTAGDARVRDSHKILDGTVLPINHLFWKTHCTPLDFGCRCNIEQTDETVSEKIPDFKAKKAFQNNPYYSGKVFNESPYADGLSVLEKTMSEKLASEMMQGYKSEMAIIEAKKEYDAFYKTIKKAFFNDENGGYLVIDKNRIAKSKINKNETAKFLKEKAISTVYANSGMKIQMLDEVAGLSSSDVLADGILADLKQTSSHNNILKYAKKAINEQGAEITLFEFTKKTNKIMLEIDRLKRLKIKAMYYFTDESIIYKTY